MHSPECLASLLWLNPVSLWNPSFVQSPKIYWNFHCAGSMSPTSTGFTESNIGHHLCCREMTVIPMVMDTCLHEEFMQWISPELLQIFTKCRVQCVIVLNDMFTGCICVKLNRIVQPCVTCWFAFVWIFKNKVATYTELNIWNAEFIDFVFDFAIFFLLLLM